MAENLQDFTLVRDIGTAEEYGRYLVEQAGDIEPELMQCINYQKYGESRIKSEHGAFIDQGYIAYLGDSPEVRAMLDRTIREEQTAGPQMGGMV